MKVVIMGASKIASVLVTLLQAEEYEVFVIDIDKDGFRRLPDNFQGEKIHGSGTDLEIYRRIGFSDEDVFIAATNSDNANLEAAKIIKENFKSRKVGTLIRDPFRARAFKEIEKGIACPILDTAWHFKTIVAG